jgi:HD-like signal output (HDOD) protein
MSHEEALKQVVDKITGLPTLPDMLTKINRLMMNPKTSAKEVAQVISSDPSITARVLRVVNSSFYGFPNRISTITHAIVILGFNTVKSIVLSSSIFEVFRKEEGGSEFDRNEFWRHSVGVGAAARAIGKRTGFDATEELFIAGLVHDVGKIILDQHLHDVFADVLAIVEQRDCLFYDAEMEVLGVTHADIGKWLFEKWNLSPGILACTSFHHNPTLAADNADAVAIIHLADVICKAIGFGKSGDDKVPLISEHAWNELGLSADLFPTLLKEVDDEIEKALVFLDFLNP